MYCSRPLALGLVLLASMPCAHAQLRTLDNYAATSFYSTDDDSTDAVDFGFTANLFGASTSSLFINNNGNVTFAFPSGLGNPQSVAGGLFEQGGPVLAPFLADVDTTYTNPFTYGQGTLGGHNAFVVNWAGVASYGQGTQPSSLNTFQLFLVDRSDLSLGDFDFEFNYAQVQWDQGANNAGVSALAGYADGSGTSFLLDGSGATGALLDGGSALTSLIANQLGLPFDGASLDGRYAFNVRAGIFSQTTGGNGGGGGTDPVDPELPGDPGLPGDPLAAVPEPSTYGLIGAALLTGVAARRRFTKNVKSKA